MGDGDEVTRSLNVTAAFNCTYNCMQCNDKSEAELTIIEDSRPFHSSALSFQGAKSPQRGLLLPWNFRSMEHSLLGTFAPVELSFLGSERSKNFRSYETVLS